MENEILHTLRTLGWQPTMVMTYCFGSDFGKCIRKLHKEGKVERYRSGWKAVGKSKERIWIKSTSKEANS